ncbi:hypothetical protein HRI_001762100 [Hibiscus trionum]|uniref:Uncharacterized protein n=1 Tax=Hibiscus trionum TaxID=183268 RepID=A0A9W7LYC4_HIBTR|nr:hypothetical protein HRI_001762100 [Hibiscus trionum]
MVLKVNQLRGVKLDYRDIDGQRNELQKLLKKRICVIFLLKESKRKEIEWQKLSMLMSRGGRVGKKGTCEHCFQLCNISLVQRVQRGASIQHKYICEKVVFIPTFLEEVENLSDRDHSTRSLASKAALSAIAFSTARSRAFAV